MLWQDVDSGTFYRLNEGRGEQVRCDARGKPIRPFDPNITGRYNYEERKRVAAKTNASIGEIDIPSQLNRPNFKRTYCPQQQRLDGYA